MSIPNDTRFDDLKAAARKLGGTDGTGQLARIELAWKVLDAARDGVIDPHAKLPKGDASPFTVLTLAYYTAQAAKLDGVESDRKPAIKQMATKLKSFAKMGASKAWDGKAVLLAAVKVMRSQGISPSLENLVTFNTAQNQSVHPLEAEAILALFLKPERAPREEATAADAAAPEPMDPEVAALTKALHDLRTVPGTPEIITAMAMISQRLEKITGDRSEVVQAVKAKADAAVEAVTAERVKKAADAAHFEGMSYGVQEGMLIERNNATLEASRQAVAARSAPIEAPARVTAPVSAPAQVAAPTDDAFDALCAEFGDILPGAPVASYCPPPSF